MSAHAMQKAQKKGQKKFKGEVRLRLGAERSHKISRFRAYHVLKGTPIKSIEVAILGFIDSCLAQTEENGFD